MDDTRLQYLRTQKDMEAKAVTHFFDKVINTDKNILLFIPVFFTTVDQSLPAEIQYETIHKEISATTSYIYDYRNEKSNGYDTYIVYAVNIPDKKELSLIIAKFTANGLEIVYKVLYTPPHIRLE